MPSVLLVDDDESDRELVTRLITRGGDWRVETAPSMSDGLAALRAAPPDVALLDLRLPDSVGIDTVRRVVRHHPDVPVVVLTGLDDEALGLQAVKEGAQDYLVKGQADRKLIDRSLRYAIERKRAERALARLAAITGALCDECGRKVRQGGLGPIES